MKQINEYLQTELITEAKRITFNNDTYPKFGWCVIMAGGSGVGKNHAIQHKLLIDAKEIDVDRMQELFIKSHNGEIGQYSKDSNGKVVKDERNRTIMTDRHKFDPKNGDDVSLAHDIMSDNGFKKKVFKALIGSHYNPDRLPNIIFNITAKDPHKDINKKILQYIKMLGYNISLVWCIADRSVAILRNISRGRSVSDKTFHDIHNKVNTNLPSYLRERKLSKDIDEAWIIWTSSNSLQHPNLDDDDTTSVVKLHKNGDGEFFIDAATETKLKRYLGRNEENITHPRTYLSQERIKKRFGRDDKGKLKLRNTEDFIRR